MNPNRHNVPNKDIRVKCLENGIRFWQIARQLGVSPETITRRLRTELPAEEKEVIYRAMEQIMQGR
jgi:lambda repressor-like predicted transcriptional regulator